MTSVALFHPPQLSIGIAVLCVPWLRWKAPELARPIKVHLIWPILYIIATIFITVVPMYAAPIETGTVSMLFNILPLYNHVPTTIITSDFFSLNISVYGVHLFVFSFSRNSPTIIDFFHSGVGIVIMCLIPSTTLWSV